MELLQHEVATALQSLSSIGTIAVAIFEGQLPATPVSAVGVISQGGPASPTGPIEIRNARWQFLCREESLAAAMRKAETVYSTFAGKWNVLPTLRGRTVPDHEVGPRFRDSNNNWVFSLNFSLFTVSSTV